MYAIKIGPPYMSQNLSIYKPGKSPSVYSDVPIDLKGQIHTFGWDKSNHTAPTVLISQHTTEGT